METDWTLFLFFILIVSLLYAILRWQDDQQTPKQKDNRKQDE